MKYNNLQSQRMSSDEVAKYLIEVGSNERKLQYCRQILAQNKSFSPLIAFNLASLYTKTSLSKNQLMQLFRFTGLTSSQEELELLYSYFQVDGKSYVTLQQFTKVISLKTNSCQNISQQNQADDKYPLKYSLQKLFLQIIKNQKSIRNLSKMEFNLKEKKSSYKRVDLASLKMFLANHGKYPTQSTLQQILKEISINKGISKLHQYIRDLILQFKQTKQSDSSRVKQNALIQNFERQNGWFLQGQINQRCKKSAPVIQIPTCLVIQESKESKKATTSKTTLQIEARIKELMSSINLKNKPDIWKGTESEILLTQRNSNVSICEQSMSQRFSKRQQSRTISEKNATSQLIITQKTTDSVDNNKQNVLLQKQTQKSKISVQNTNKIEYWKTLIKQRPPSAFQFLKSARI